MSRLTWDDPSSRVFEAGLDRGVLYLENGTGVVWNGLISVSEQNNTTTEPIYFDGMRFNNLPVLSDFSATMTAYTYPDAFLEYEGVAEFQDGVYMADQPLKPFGLSYRTKIGNEYDLDQGYKIHILYNLTAVPGGKEYRTMGLDIEPLEFEWDLQAVPEELPGYRPTAHVIIDSRQIDDWLLQDIEDILYGDDEGPAQLPSLKALSSFIKKWERIIITDNGDGTWTAESRNDDYITMVSETEFQITEANATYIDPPDNETYEISSTEKNEEDL